MIGRIIVLDFTGKPGFEFGCVEMGYKPSSADTIHKTFPVILQIVADGGQCPHPGNYYTPHVRLSEITTWRFPQYT
jgi:hypothetical protein